MYKKGKMKEKLVGTILLCAIVPLAVISYLFIVVVGTFGNPARVRQGVRALDHFVNATLFNGYAWESLSSHAWRERDKRWAKIVIKITDFFDKNHCQKANKREQPIVDLVLARKLTEQTVGKQL
ncbi:hypothetical protein A0068_07160 [Campylobacter lari]|uniref:Succinylglutamate desuccinylase n=2 Tax=Campylobacter subantarcticus TaxID=497724 RepID=A0ABW9N3D9_9BACT|nr:succinylglutamate desuccinylase [Campylobacter lari]EAL3939439.1 hypothetical protein [Campylobacter lari]MPB98798.1 succinylglutamate desuccinylase [Campylobacter subantarcticus]